MRQAYGVGGKQILARTRSAHGAKLSQYEKFSLQTWARLVEENWGAEVQADGDRHNSEHWNQEREANE